MSFYYNLWPYLLVALAFTDFFQEFHNVFKIHNSSNIYWTLPEPQLLIVNPSNLIS